MLKTRSLVLGVRLHLVHMNIVFVFFMLVLDYLSFSSEICWWWFHLQGKEETEETEKKEGEDEDGDGNAEEEDDEDMSDDDYNQVPL